jgi:hypothetical protein
MATKVKARATYTDSTIGKTISMGAVFTMEDDDRTKLLLDKKLIVVDTSPVPSAFTIPVKAPASAGAPAGPGGIDLTPKKAKE